MKNNHMAIRIILPAAGAALLLAFLVPSVITDNYHIGTWTGVIIAAVMIIYSVWGNLRSMTIHFVRDFAAGKIVAGIIVLAAAAILVLAVMCMICMGTAMNRNPCENSTIVVLGCRVYSCGPGRMLTARLDAACDYLEENPEASAVLCGGQGSNEPRAEADVMYEYLTGKGISPERLYVDDTSADTLENLTNARQIIEENGLNPQISVVTSSYHMYRGLKYAESLDFKNPGAVTASVEWWLFLPNYVREMYGILEMWFLYPALA